MKVYWLKHFLMCVRYINVSHQTWITFRFSSLHLRIIAAIIWQRFFKSSFGTSAGRNNGGRNKDRTPEKGNVEILAESSSGAVSLVDFWPV